MATKVAREGKGDGGRQPNQQKGGGGQASETGVLFPRLHVKEREKAGPRAPPRNKMALYEQFTIPSQGFVPPSFPLAGSGRSAAASPYVQPYFSNECRFSYPTFYMPPTLGYGAVNVGIHANGQPSLGVSSGNAVVDNESDSQRVPGPRSSEKDGPSAYAAVNNSATRNTSSSCKNHYGKKAKDNRVLNFSVQKDGSRVSDYKCAQKSEKPHELCMSLSRNLARPAVDFSAIADCQQEESISCRTRIECPGPELVYQGDIIGVNSRGFEKSSHDAIGEVQLQVESTGGEKNVEIDHEDQSTTLQGCLSQQSDSDDDVYIPEQDVPSQCQRSRSIVESIAANARLKIQGIAVGNCVTALRDQAYPFKARTSSRNVGLNVDITDVGANRPHKLADPVMEEDSVVNTGGSNIIQLQTSFRNNCESTGESQNPSSGSGEVSEPSQPGEATNNDDSDSSMLDSISVPNILPKDVMKAVGQQQFWRARRAILRQQRIFSDQVFELHKLVKIQKLLATAPNPLIEDSLHGPSDMTPECDGDVPNIPDKDEAGGLDSKAQNSGAFSSDETQSHTLGQGIQPGVACYPSWFGNGGTRISNYAPHGPMYFGPYPSMPAIMPGGMSAWGYPQPNLGLGQFLGPMAARSGPCVYRPFLGSFPPASAFGGAYGSAMGPTSMGPAAFLGAPSMVSFNFPVGDEQTQPPSDMYLRDGLSGQPWQSAVSCNPAVTPIGPDYSASWYAMQGHLMNPACRVAVAGNQEEVPSGSIASNSNQPERSTQTTKPPAGTATGIAFNSQWTNYINSSSGQPGVEEFNSPHVQAEQSNVLASAGMKGNLIVAPLQSVVQGQAHADEASWKERGDAYTGLERQLKCQKEGLKAAVRNRKLDDTDVEAQDSLDQFRNALHLFPLAPISTAKDKRTGQAEEWQGRVIKAIPHAAVAATESAKGILLSIQQERKQ